MTDQDDALARQARVVATVMERITADSAPRPVPAPRIDVLAFWRPALAAAAVAAVASSWSMTRSSAPETVLQALDLPAPVTRWVQSGDPAPLLEVTDLGGQP